METTLGIVKFANNADVLHDLVKIMSDDQRTSLKEVLPKVSDKQHTCIGCGLALAHSCCGLGL